MNPAPDPPFQLHQDELPRLRRRLAWNFGAAWTAGLGVLLAVALWEGLNRLSEEVDGELEVRAALVYGLAWFNEGGVLQSHLLEREPIAHDPDFPVRIFSKTSEQEPVLGPPLSRNLSSDVLGPIREVIEQRRDSWSGDIGGERVYLLPMFPEESDEPVGVACVAHPLSAMHARQLRFVALLGGTFFALAGLGVVVALRLARSSVRPIQAMLTDRERFLAGAAHELRQPVTTILAVSESAQESDEDAMPALARVAKAARGAARRVEALLAYARLESGTQDIDFVPTRIDLIVERAVESFPLAVLDLKEVVASVDVALFEVAIVNLLANAERYGAGESGRGISITLRRGMLRVDDSGAGFPKSLVGGGAPPYGGSSSPHGHGIGLTLVARIARLHNGDLRCDNGEAGASVTMTFAGSR